MNWTPNQRRAITATGRDVLVSAGAGSGKTAVLAERCAHLVAEAEPRCRVDQLLVVTFTEAAAAEMRSRIAAALQARAAAGAGGWLRRQVALIDLAPICTIHAFCRRLLSQHFAVAGVDPAFGLLDENEATLLREDAWEQLQSELHAGGDPLTDAYEELVHCYGGGRDEQVRAFVFQLCAFLESLPDPREWLRRARSEFESLTTAAPSTGGPSTGAPSIGALSPGALSPGALSTGALSTGAPAAHGPVTLPPHWHDIRRRLVFGELSDLRSRLNEVLGEYAAVAAAGTWIDYIDEFRQRLDGWTTRAAAANAAELDAICGEMTAFEFARKPSRSRKAPPLPADDQAACDAAEEAVIAIRDAFKKYRGKGDLLFRDADFAAGLLAIAPHVRCVADLSERYAARYVANKQRLGMLDFADLERRALNLLRDSPATRDAVRDQYEYVLVDEFQDVSPIQAELLQLVSRGDDPARTPNLFCVGDVKQSIYRFRLAEPAVFVERMHASAYEPAARQGLRVDLPENFRSQAHLIDAINRIMSRLMSPELGLVSYDDAAKLAAAASPQDRPPLRPALELHLLTTAADADGDAEDEDAEDEDAIDDAEPGEGSIDLERIEREALVVAARIHRLRAEQPGVRWRDVVLLMRSPSHRVGPLSARLAERGVPVYSDRAGGYFDALEVRDLRSLLCLLDNGRQDIPLAALLRSPLSAALAGEAHPRLPLDESDLVRLRVHRRGEPFHESANAYAQDGADAALRGAVRRLFDRVSDLRRAARRETVADLLARIYAETACSGYVRGLPSGRQRAARLTGLHEHARRFGRFARQGLHRFLDFLDELEARESQPDGAGEASAGDDVVRIMSIHAAKGLQFPYVFLLDAGAKFNLSDLRQQLVFDRATGIGLRAVDPAMRITYPTLAYRHAAERMRGETLSEELRLLYVALTRAERQVFVVGTPHSPRAAERPLRPRPPGLLPLAERRGAASLLDWVAMAVWSQPTELVRLADEPAKDAPLFTLHRAAAPATAAPVARLQDQRALPAWVDAALALAPLPASAGQAERVHVQAAQACVERIGRSYRHAALTRIPSVIAASELKRRWAALDDPDLPAAGAEALAAPADGHGAGLQPVRIAGRKPSPQPRNHFFGARDWRRPRAGMAANAAAPSETSARAPGSGSASPTDRGTWTHLFLERLDLTAACDRAGLRAQLARLVERGGLAASEAALIDLDGIEWFFQTDAGRRLRENAATVRRETPFVMAVEPGRYDPQAAHAAAADRNESPSVVAGDFIVTRGIVDCWYESEAGLTVLDWKTDSVAGDELKLRADLYRGQLDIYARAIGDLLQRPVTTRLLAFLTARQIVEV